MAIEAPQPAEALLRSLPDPVVFVDALGTIVEASERIDEIGGWTRVALVGTSYLQLFPERLREELDRTFAGWLSSGRSTLERRSVRLPALAVDGSEFELEMRVDRLDDGFVAVVRNAWDPGSGLRAGLLDAVSAESVTSLTIADVLALIGDAFPWDAITMWGVDEQTATLRAVAVWEREPDPGRAYRSATLRQPFAIGQGLPGEAWQRSSILWRSPLDDDPRFAGRELGEHRPRCGAFVPILVGHRTVGVLELVAAELVDADLWLESEMAIITGPLGHLLERFRDRMAAEAAEGRLAVVIDAGEFGVWTLDPRSGHVQWSARVAEVHGIEPDAGGGRLGDVFAHVHADDLDALRHAVERASSADDPISIDYRVVVDGQLR